VFFLHAQSLLLLMLLIEAKLPDVLAMIISLWVVASFYAGYRRLARLPLARIHPGATWTDTHQSIVD
jgi:hypothetical protein